MMTITGSEKTLQNEICGFIKVKGRRVHYRQLGSGPPILMLHPSPLSSKFMRSNMRAFSEFFCCIAFDSPGFGLSDPLTERHSDMFAYADALKEVVDHLSLEKPIIYGVATGAAITHAFGCKYPEDAGLLMLDTFGHYDTEDTVNGYFPDVVPKRDGSHLLTCWEKVTGLYSFLPWQRAQADRRMIRAWPDAAVLNDMVIQQLMAGPDYRHAYRAAIIWEDKGRIGDLKAPVTLNVWPQASGREKVQELIDAGLPENYTLIHANDNPSGRYSKQVEYLVQAGLNLATPFSDTANIPSSEQEGPDYITTEFGQIFIRFASPTGQPAQYRPLLFLHDWGSSSTEHQSLIAAMGKERHVIAPDLPGHGDTIADATDVDGIMACLMEVIAQTAKAQVDVLAVGSATALGYQLKKRHPEKFRNIGYLATRPLTREPEHIDKLSSAVSDLVPRHSGAHLVSAFGIARMEALFWHWQQPVKHNAVARDDALNAGRLNQRTLDLLRTRADMVGLARQSAEIAGEISDNDEVVCFAPDWQVNGEPLSKRLKADHQQVRPLPSNEFLWVQKINEYLS